MSEEKCTSNCSSCNKECGIRKETTNELSHVKKVIGVVSGKGGVGKSTITSLLASKMAKRCRSTAILDADITGPSIPRAFDVSELKEQGEYVVPPVSKGGTKIMSVNLLLENDTDPAVWRAPVISSMVKQFYTEVVWGDVDYMFVDMPPGTGDVSLTVYQSLPVDGIIIVTSPQDLVGMIVEKAIKMAEIMHVPVLGIVENMAYYKCDECGKKHFIFGESKVEAIAKAHNVDTYVSLPIRPDIARSMDTGMIEYMDEDNIDVIVKMLESL